MHGHEAHRLMLRAIGLLGFCFGKTRERVGGPNPTEEWSGQSTEANRVEWLMGMGDEKVRFLALKRRALSSMSPLDIVDRPQSIH